MSRIGSKDLLKAITLLVVSIREHGQQVPVMVRPHPEKDGRYQIVYGRQAA